MLQYFSRIGTESANYYILTKFENGGEEGFEITLCDGQQVWHQKVDAGKVESLAKAVDEDVSEFSCQTIRALTGQETGQDNFVYHAKPQGSNLQFSWKKRVGDGIKFQLGSLTLIKVTNHVSVLKEIFDLAVDQMLQLKLEISSLKSDNARLSAERRDALQLLDKCVSTKEELESDLFQKFAAVLNDKKSKIRELKSQVENALSAASTAMKEHQVPNSGLRTIESTKAISSNRKDSSDNDTDAEMVELSDDRPQPSHSTSVATGRSKAHENLSSTMFSPSLLEDSNEEIQVAAKRRRRREVKPKESPAAKLVLPKVPSVKKTPSSSSADSSTSSRSRLRRKASERSLPDADDLMAEMEK